MALLELFDLIVLDNPLRNWFLALLIAAGVLAAVSLWRWLVTHRLRPLVLRTNTFLDDVAVVLAETTFGPIVLLLAAYAGSLVLEIAPAVRLALRSIAIALFLVQLALWGNALIRRWVEHYSKLNAESNAAGTGTARLIGLLARFVLYTIVLLLLLDNLPGVEITALVASLGIGGIAVALAAQNILGDLFASLSIALDKPFVVGDFIAVGDDFGTVELIGLKTTRIKSLSGEELSFPNGVLVSGRIRNFARMEQRRIVFTFRVTYGTTPEQLSSITGIVRDLVAEIEQTRFDRATLMRFDDLGLVFEVVYFVLSPDYNLYAAIQQKISMRLIETLSAHGIGFAYLSDASAADRQSRREDRA